VAEHHWHSGPRGGQVGFSLRPGRFIVEVRWVCCSGQDGLLWKSGVFIVEVNVVHCGGQCGS
jgi:hypothetical protein